MSDRFTVEIIDEGRSGWIRYSEGHSHVHQFYWEFGGADAVVLISVPTPKEWPSAVPWAAKRRTEILDRVAIEACRQRCPGCRPVLTDRSIDLHEP